MIWGVDDHDDDDYNNTDTNYNDYKDHGAKDDVLDKDMLLTNNEDSKCDGI